VLLAACSSPSSPTPCAPNATYAGGGTVVLGSGGPTFVVSTSQAEDFLNGGSLTVTAGENDAGAGPLQPTDPVVAVSMKATTDASGTYTLESLQAKAAHCGADEKLVVTTTSMITGCAKASGAMGTEVIAPLHGSVVVDSAQKKALDGDDGNGGIALHLGFGQQGQTCQ
jgi:hypothetical protein